MVLNAEQLPALSKLAIPCSKESRPPPQYGALTREFPIFKAESRTESNRFERKGPQFNLFAFATQALNYLDDFTVKMSTDNGTKQCQLILALDLEDRKSAIELLQRAGSELQWVKIGLQMFTRYGPDYVREIASLGKRVFLDLKLHDIPNTVAKAVESISELPIDMLTIHTSGGKEMMRRAVASQQEAAPNLKLLGVTVLTSMDQTSLSEIGIGRSPEEQVLALADLASMAGMSGLVCSPHEVGKIHAIHGDTFALVTPGIRPSGSDAGDQKRIMTPSEAARAGSDFIVVGRPIYQAANPQEVVSRIHEELQTS